MLLLHARAFSHPLHCPASQTAPSLTTSQAYTVRVSALTQLHWCNTASKQTLCGSRSVAPPAGLARAKQGTHLPCLYSWLFSRSPLFPSKPSLPKHSLIVAQKQRQRLHRPNRCHLSAQGSGTSNGLPDSEAAGGALSLLLSPLCACRGPKERCLSSSLLTHFFGNLCSYLRLAAARSRRGR